MFSDQEDSWIGRNIQGRYRLDSLLGRGGMGKVYKAFDKHLSTFVAIKFMLQTSEDNQTDRERFRREITATLKFQDPRIILVFDSGIEEGSLFFVSEYIPHPTLGEVLKQEQKFDIARALNIGFEISAALQTLHDGVLISDRRVRFIHRDLKPSNIFLIPGNPETIKLADFGLVKFQGSLSMESLSDTGRFMGTAKYASPEQCRGQKNTIDSRSDIYSLGCIFYEMLTGTNPFDLNKNSDHIQWIYAHISKMPKPFPEAVNVPDNIQQIVFKCLEKEPQNRFSSAKELSDTLRSLDILSHKLPIDLSSFPTKQVSQIKPKQIYLRLFFILGYVIGVFGLVILGILVFKSFKSNSSITTQSLPKKQKEVIQTIETNVLEKRYAITVLPKGNNLDIFLDAELLPLSGSLESLNLEIILQSLDENKPFKRQTQFNAFQSSLSVDNIPLDVPLQIDVQLLFNKKILAVATATRSARDLSPIGLIFNIHSSVPVLEGITPSVASISNTVTLIGKNLESIDRVTFTSSNKNIRIPVVAKDNRVRIPVGATTGLVVAVNKDGLGLGKAEVTIKQDK
jgi:serine/threonine protein kinase